MIAFDEACALVSRVATPLGTERVPIERGRGRVLAAPVRARIGAPTTDVSKMDGYAVRDADLASPDAALKVVGESFPVRGFGGAVGAGECVRIFTGAPIPAGADRVVIQEVVRRRGDHAVIEAADGPRYVRERGSDFEAGDLLVQPGRMLDARALLAAAGGDVDELEVWCKPKTIVLGTGDELVEPGQARDTGAVPDSATLGVAALAAEWGAEILDRHLLPDDLERLIGAAQTALDGADLVIVTGGASVGERDFAKAMFEPAGLELVFSKVVMKPGKPVWLGRARERLVLGLPGNPTSALVTARLLLAPLLAGLTGRDAAEALRWRALPLAGPLPAGDAREEFVRATANGETASPLPDRDSGAQRMLVGADLLIRRRPNAPAAQVGERVEVLDF